MYKQKPETPPGGIARRKFLGFIAAGAAISAVGFNSCTKDPTRIVYNDHVDLGVGDIAILNLAYVIEQLEAAFYTRVVASPYANMSNTERVLLTDIRDHEVAHREFFKSALNGNAVGALTPNFGTINFADRGSVLAAAKSFEDLGLTAYNGSAYLFKKSDYLLLAGKIVSVEARHAALIDNLISPASFADSLMINNNGLDAAKSPQEVVPLINSMLKDTKVIAPDLGIY
ncbi:ferritin-like domain-containing protein [Mucilaginibacter agri]|uniref:Ferritin-like domain-containing protein n=1 Tax=Mucilaginibacter agri TaxID=2695265 RepID=A0A966DRD3_9SPHI|nr:ferritin-like domain-containing protein [Mucilaginibacter agri]NCD68948.1 ferritin-like domain-containing protein [Mucilaginibacter agri]